MKNIYSDRKYIIGGIFVVIVSIYTLRLLYLQVFDPQYRKSASNNVLRYITQYPARGLVYDRKGELLVFNEAAYDLMVIPNQLKSFDTLDFCKLLDITKEQVVLNLTKAKKYSTYKSSIFLKQLSAQRYAMLQEKLFKYPGFFVQTRTLRKYPTQSAAHLLGYVGEVDERVTSTKPYYVSGDYIGISGIESAYEEVVRGEKGVEVFLVDVHNRIMGNYKNGKYDTIAKIGGNITTGLDAQLQRLGESLMQNKIGSIVAIEPATGEILALISSPSYNPNLLVGRVRSKNYDSLSKDITKPLFNRALMAKYPPGSTFKLINALIGLQEGVIVPSTTFSCNMGFSFGGLTVGCHEHPSPLNLQQSIQSSCNSYYCNTFRRIIDNRKYRTVAEGFAEWRRYVTSFGFGNKLGSDLSTELRGYIPTVDFYDKYHGRGRWRSISIISLAIGQGELGITPLQMANMTAILANRGYYITPHVVKKIDGINQIDPSFLKRHYIPIDRRYFDLVVDAMELVVKSGTARVAYMENISICGKTGTAQNPHGEDHSIFVAFAPKVNPKIAIAVYVENGGFGATYAAPIASLMIEKYLTDSIRRPAVEKFIEDVSLIEKMKLK